MNRRPWRVLSLPLITGGLLALIGYHPTKMLAGAAGVRGMLLGQVTVLLAVCCSLLPAVKRIPAAGAGERLKLALKAAAIRFALTVLLAAAVALGTRVPPAAFLIWLGITYVVVVQAETFCLVRWMKELERSQ